jgi:hypothetical protein
MFRFVSKQVVSVIYRNREFRCWIEPKQTEDQPKQCDREYILVFFKKFRVSVSFETPKQTETNRNFLFLVSLNKPKHNRNISCFRLFRFKPKFLFVCFEDTLLPTQTHPTPFFSNVCQLIAHSAHLIILKTFLDGKIRMGLYLPLRCVHNS